MTLLQSGIAKPSSGHTIDQSLRLNQYDASRLQRTPSSVGNRKTWTWSGWLKRGYLNPSNQHWFFSSADSSERQSMAFLVDQIYFEHTNSSGSGYMISDRMFRDTSAWYHIVLVWDTTQATSTNRVKIYVNGEQLTSFTGGTGGTGGYPSLNQQGEINNTSGLYIGSLNTYAGYYYDGCLSEVNFIDGQALTPASFGETNLDTNQWIAKKYAGSYGTNGFYLKFQDSSALGDDSSGNTNDFTVTNLAATDQVLDSPTNNFATMNPLDPFHAGSSTFSEGNLKVSEAGGNAQYTQVSNLGMSSGKWYFEFCGVNSDNSWMLGVADVTKGLSRGYTGTSGEGLYIYVDGDKYSPTSSSSYGVSWTHGDVMGIAVDMDNNAMYFAKNNTWMNSGSPTSGASKTGAAYTTELANKTWVAAMGRGSTSNTITGTFNFGQDSSFAGAKTAQGNGGDGEDFYYTPPTGYKALNTNNLDDPSIADPTKHFNTKLWTSTSADGTSALGAVTGVGFQPDLVWAKGRSAAWDHSLFNSVMGTGLGKALYANTYFIAGAYDTSGYGNVTSFDSDGFTVGLTAGNNYAYNYGSGTEYLAWNWKAGGTAVSNSDGSVTSSVSANTTAGMSVVTWTNNNVTVGHGLSQAPELIIMKNTEKDASWLIYSEPVGNAHALFLNTTDAQDAGSGYFNSTSPTASVFSVGTTGGTLTDDFVAFCFHSVDGYSKVGSYAGYTDGPFVHTGFLPAFIFIKRVTSAGSNSYIVDSKRIGYNNFVYATDNGSNKYLWPDAATAESGGNSSKGMGLDIVSNGFKLRTSNGDYNSNGNTYLYMAFAESPFKYSNAR